MALSIEVSKAHADKSGRILDVHLTRSKPTGPAFPGEKEVKNRCKKGKAAP
jgi:hypothetical protein